LIRSSLYALKILEKLATELDQLSIWKIHPQITGDQVLAVPVVLRDLLLNWDRWQLEA
jgi:hypothetical protein